MAKLGAPLALVVMATGLTLFGAACGGGSAHDGVANLSHGKTTTTAQSSAPAGSSAGNPASYSVMLKYSQCMRSHGVPGFPDPSTGPNGGYGFKITPSDHLDQGSPQFSSAQKACQKLLPNGGVMTPAEQANALAHALRYTQCMRSHGVPNFPDPTTGGGGVGIQISRSSGINPNSPQFQAASKACQKFFGP